MYMLCGCVAVLCHVLRPSRAHILSLVFATVSDLIFFLHREHQNKSNLPRLARATAKLFLAWLWQAAARLEPSVVHFVLQVVEPEPFACRAVRPFERVTLSTFPVVHIVNVVRVHLVCAFDLRQVFHAGCFHNICFVIAIPWAFFFQIMTKPCACHANDPINPSTPQKKTEMVQVMLVTILCMYALPFFGGGRGRAIIPAGAEPLGLFVCACKCARICACVCVNVSARARARTCACLGVCVWTRSNCKHSPVNLASRTAATAKPAMSVLNLRSAPFLSQPRGLLGSEPCHTLKPTTRLPIPYAGLSVGSTMGPSIPSYPMFPTGKRPTNTIFLNIGLIGDFF